MFEPAYDPAELAHSGGAVGLSLPTPIAPPPQIETEAAKIDAERVKKQEEYINRTFDKEAGEAAGEHARGRPHGSQDAGSQAHSRATAACSRSIPVVNVSAGSLYLYDHKAGR